MAVKRLVFSDELTSVGSGTYLPLSGGTLTGNITGTGATFTGDVTLSSTNSLLIPSGSSVASLPFAFKDDTNTGMWNPSNNAIGFVTDGTERVNISDTGTVTLSSDLLANGGLNTGTDMNNRAIISYDSGALTLGTRVSSTNYFDVIKLNETTTTFSGIIQNTRGTHTNALYGSGTSWILESGGTSNIILNSSANVKINIGSVTKFYIDSNGHAIFAGNHYYADGFDTYVNSVHATETWLSSGTPRHLHKGDLIVNGTTTVVGHVAPTVNNAVRLGSNSLKFEHGYFSNTVYAGTFSGGNFTGGTLSLTSHLTLGGDLNLTDFSGSTDNTLMRIALDGANRDIIKLVSDSGKGVLRLYNGANVLGTEIHGNGTSTFGGNAIIRGELLIHSQSLVTSNADIDKIKFQKSHPIGAHVGSYTLGEIRSYTNGGYSGGMTFYTGANTGGGSYASTLAMTLDHEQNATFSGNIAMSGSTSTLHATTSNATMQMGANSGADAETEIWGSKSIKLKTFNSSYNWVDAISINREGAVTFLTSPIFTDLQSKYSSQYPTTATLSTADTVGTLNLAQSNGANCELKFQINGVTNTSLIPNISYHYTADSGGSTAYNQYFKMADGTNIGQIEFHPTSTSQIVTRVNQPLAFGVNNSHKMTIGTDGNVTFGVGGSFADKVYFNGRVRINKDGQIHWGSAYQQGYLSWDTNEAIIGGLASNSLRIQSGGATAMVLNTSQDIALSNSAFTLGTGSNVARLYYSGGGGQEYSFKFLDTNNTYSNIHAHDLNIDGGLKATGNLELYTDGIRGILMYDSGGDAITCFDNNLRPVTANTGEVGTSADSFAKAHINQVNIQPASSGATAHTEADNLIVEDSATPGMSILFPSNSKGSLMFGHQSNNSAFSIVADSNNNRMSFSANQTYDVMRFNVGGSRNLELSGASGSEQNSFTGKVIIDGASRPAKLAIQGHSNTSDIGDNLDLNIHGGNNTNLLTQIGIGYSGASVYPNVVLATKVTDSAVHTKHDFLIALRETTTGGTRPVEKFRIKADGTATFSGQILSSGVTSTHQLLHLKAGSGNHYPYMRITRNDGSYHWDMGMSSDSLSALFFKNSAGNNALKLDTDLSATFGGQAHIKLATAGSSVVANTENDDLVIETNGNTGMTMLSPDANDVGLGWGSASLNRAVLGKWNYNANSFRLRTNKANAIMVFGGGESLNTLTLDGSGNSTFGGNLDISRGASDDAYLKFSSSDSGHGVTDIIGTTTFGFFDKVAYGHGLRLTGFSNNTGVSPLNIRAVADNGVSNSIPAMEFQSLRGNGATGTASIVDAGISFRFKNDATSLLDLYGNGSATFSGQILASNGTASAPAFSFASQASTGMYKGGTSLLYFSVNGTRKVRVESTQIVLEDEVYCSDTLGVTGNATFSGDILLGSDTTAPDVNTAVDRITLNGGTNGSVLSLGRDLDSTTGQVGVLSFYNRAITGGEKRLAHIQTDVGGANNSGLLQFYVMNSGSIGKKMEINRLGNATHYGNIIIDQPDGSDSTLVFKEDGTTKAKIYHDESAGTFNITDASDTLTLSLKNGKGYFQDRCYVSVSTLVTSDKKFKDNVKTIESALDKTSQLRGVSYTDNRNGKEKIGVIAQEIQEHIPTAVEMDSRTLHVDYNQIIPMLIESIKELKTEVESLKAKLGE